jgi:hypothetical protein
LYRLAPKVLGALAIVKLETVIKWHRAGFGSWCLSQIKSGHTGGAVRRGLGGKEYALRS